uniref:aminopeptidase N n=1 Tax=Myxine glutinosa TaxID=7769 RepID=UPI00358F8C8C
MGKGYYVSTKVAICLGLAVIVIIVAVGLLAGLLPEKDQCDHKCDITTRAPIKSSTFEASTKPFPSTTTSEPSTPTPSQASYSYRLPPNVVPVHYNLELKPILDPETEGNYTFSGNVEILMNCEINTSTLFIHSHNLQYDDQISLFNAEGKELRITPKNDAKQQYLILELDDGNMESGKSYTFKANFSGNLANDLSGFYRSEYVEDGKPKVMATSQMEPADARKAFPCFDEPEMKATFNVTLIHKCERVPLSNMPVSSSISITNDGWCATKFEQTPKMSTYLMAFIVSDFTFIEDNSTFLVRVFARKSEIKAGRAARALRVAKEVLDYFGTLFDFPYSLPKSDQIGIPDFAAGAMENWGLVTYRETALLYDKNESSESNKERVVSVIAHELTHQWFGDLVTIEWWSELWLNEGFATYFSYLGTNAVEPGWNFLQGFILDDFQRALLADSYSSSRPLSAPHESIVTPADMSSVFDDISYSKGGSILRMMNDILGNETFIKGLRTYVKELKYNNTNVHYLLGHLQEAVTDDVVKLPATVEEIFSNWTQQMGYPCVSINKSGIISQSHFLMNPTSNVTRISPHEYIWTIPIRWISNSTDETQTHWLRDKYNNMTIPQSDSWILLNAGAVGFYRVQYDDDLFSNLLTQLQLNHSVIPLENRAQLIDDTFNLATAGLMKIEDALDTTIYLVDESEYVPWQTAINNLGYINLMFSMSMSYGNLQTYMKKQIRKIYDDYHNFAVIPESHFDQYMQVSALSTACTYDIRECRTEAQKLFASMKNSSRENQIKANLRYIVYCNAIAAGGQAEWEFALEMYKNSSFSMEKAKILSALSCSKEPWILSRLLNYTLDESIIRKQDATKAIISVANNVVGQSLAWSFLKDQWNYIFQQYGIGAFSFSNLISGVTQRFSTSSELEELQDFKVNTPDFGSGTAAMDRAIEQTTTNIKWRKDNEERINIWLQDHIK